MSESTPLTDADKQALKDKMTQAGETPVKPTRDGIIAQTIAEQDAEATMRKALDALEEYQRQNAPTPEEQAEIDAASAQRRQDVLQRRQEVITKFNTGKPPGEQVANLTPPKATESATPLPPAVTGKK